MGESACLMQPFSYSAPEGGDSLGGALGQSVSFGRFTSEKLDWEKWSAFSTQNRYVAEAERYSKPGSVAQKKAFFEAHYKQLAAARKAAAEEALLLQHQIPTPQPEELPAVRQDINGAGNNKWLVSKPDLEFPRGSLDMKSLAEKEGEEQGYRRQSDEKENCGMAESEINGKVSTREEQVEEEKPILILKKKSKDSQPKSSTKPRVSKYSSSERTPSNKSSSYTFTPAKEFNRLVSIIRKIDGSRASSKPTKDCKTPLRTPSNKVSANRIAEDLLSTPLSSNTSKCRGKIAPDSSAKTSRGRWNFLPAETPSCFTPFGLRTEERAERRKKKLEEKFKAIEAQDQKQEERSVEKEGSKLRQRLCFKAKPLPNFYKQRPKSTDQTKKALLQ